jgi:eukaryotic-like serine/threonine-protein kinase
MNAQRHQKIGELYHGALDLAPERRADFLRMACAGDEDLLQEVQSLLAAHHEARDFISTPAIEVVAAALAKEQSGLPAAASTSLRRIGPYQLVSLLGRGGMGEVYRAHDARLGRDVAVKILPERLALDAQHLARFEREARVLASLNHPNIAALYGIEEARGGQALVMELVEGVTLADRLGSGKIPMREVLTIASQIAEALEAAHEQGIIHRDLKPANISVRPDGTVKVLDFGLAKAVDRDGREGVMAGITASSAVGSVLGTAAYMSPEQARGGTVDRQTDVWAFGCVLYEMLTGQRAFAGESVSDVIARIIERDPDFDALPAATPPAVRLLVRRCLQKNVRDRLRHIGDAVLELRDLRPADDVAPDTPSKAAVANGRLWLAAGAIALAVLAGVAGWVLALRSTSKSPAAVVRLSIPSLEPPSLLPYGGRHLAISVNGSRVAYASANRLLIRRMGQKEAVAIEGAASSNPFFSPNGEWVGFFGQGGGTGLKKVSALGGTPVPIVMTSDRPGGGTWRADGTIVFATSEGLYQVSENGGEPRLLLKPEPRRKERAYVWPQFMPDGRSVLFTIVLEDSIEGAQIAVLDLNTLEVRIVVKGGSAARYASTGHLVYASGPTLKAIAFDPAGQQTRGDPVSLPDIEIATAPDNGAAEFAVSETGTLAFITPNLPGQLLRTLWWIDRQGNEEPLALAPGRYVTSRISPDGTRVALDISGANRDIWIWNLQRPGLTKLTGGPTEDMLPVWSRDGRRVFFASNRTGNFDVYSQAADGATMERVEFAGPGTQFPISFTPDGSRLIVIEDFKDLSLLHLARPDRLEPLLHSEFNERLGVVSPDGNWIAYESDESGDQTEIFLRPFPNVSARREKVSIDGGRYPLWGANGSGDLFYVDLNGGMMAASVKLSPNLTLGRVTKLFDSERPPRVATGTGRAYDLSPVDGRFLMTKPARKGSDGFIEISVVLNWTEELKRLVPTR